MVFPKILDKAEVAEKHSHIIRYFITPVDLKYLLDLTFFTFVTDFKAFMASNYSFILKTSMIGTIMVLFLIIYL